MLLGTLGANLLENMLAGKGTMSTSEGQGAIQADKETIRAGQNF